MKNTNLIILILFGHQFLLGLPFALVPVILEPDLHLKSKRRAIERLENEKHVRMEVESTTKRFCSGSALKEKQPTKGHLNA